MATYNKIYMLGVVMKLVLNCKDILNKKFKSNVKGYDPVEVDSFLDKVLLDYKTIDKEVDLLNSQIISLKRDNETLKAALRDKDAAISIEKSKNIALSGSHQSSLDNLELLQRCSAYEKKLYQLGIDPSKVK